MNKIIVPLSIWILGVFLIVLLVFLLGLPVWVACIMALVFGYFVNDISKYIDSRL